MDKENRYFALGAMSDLELLSLATRGVETDGVRFDYPVVRSMLGDRGLLGAVRHEQNPNDAMVPIYEGDEMIFIPVTEYYTRHRGWAAMAFARNERTGDY